MKIAFLTPEYPHPKTGNSGGLGTSIVGVAKGLVAKGHKAMVIVYGQDADATFNDNGVEIHKLKNVKLKGLSLFLTQKKVERYINTQYALGKIDLVEAPDWTGFTAFVKPKCPLIIRENGSDTYFCHLDDRKVKPQNRFLEKMALKRAKAIIAVSAFTGRLTNYLFNMEKPFTVIPNSIDASNFLPRGEGTSENIILYFGTLIRKKGLLELPHIFNKVFENNNNARLILVGKDSGDAKTGSTSTWEMMKPLFNDEAFKNVDYKGAVPYAEVGETISQANVCVFPTFAEALPVSWLEAMAMEKAIVASNIGWATEVIDDGLNGFLVHPENHTEYAKKINLLLENSKMRNDFGAEARKKIVSHFDINVVTEENIAFYKKLID